MWQSKYGKSKNYLTGIREKPEKKPIISQKRISKGELNPSKPLIIFIDL